MNKEKLKEKLIDELIDQTKKDLEQGDSTVLAEMFEHLPVDFLIQSLGEERWKDYKSLLSFQEQKKLNIFTDYSPHLIKKFNEEMHFDLKGDDLYTLDESELEEFQNWLKRN